MLDFIILFTLIALIGINIKQLIKTYKFKKNKSVVSFKESLDLCNLPIITVQNPVMGKLNLLIDTGATNSLISIEHVQKYAAVNTDNSMAVECGGGSIASYAEIETGIKIRDNSYNIKFIASDISYIILSIKNNSGVTIHGIIGNDFLEKYKYTIDFSDCVIY